MIKRDPVEAEIYKNQIAIMLVLVILPIIQQDDLMDGIRVESKEPEFD